MANTLNGNDMAAFLQTKVGTPYVYGCKGSEGPLTLEKLNKLAVSFPSIFTGTYLMKIARKGLVGQVCTDCSGLVEWYTRRYLSSSQLYAKAYARLPISYWEIFALGTVLWKQGHVGVYLGNGLVVEAKNIDYGTVFSDIKKSGWKCGLTFDWIDYDIPERVNPTAITYKGENPFPEPEGLLRKGDRGDEVKWLQWELVESGFKLDVDGVFGTSTEYILKVYQKTCRLMIDGICGAQTRNALKANL